MTTAVLHVTLMLHVVMFRTDVNYTCVIYSPNSTWLVTSQHDTFVVSSPCILALSSLSNSTARPARHYELDSLDTTSSTCATRNLVMITVIHLLFNLGYSLTNLLEYNLRRNK